MIQHRILYRVIDETGTTFVGRNFGEEDCRELIEILNKRYRDNQLIYVELEESVEHVDLTDEERDILIGLEQD